MSSVSVIPCIQGKMGNTDFYQATMTASDLVHRVRAASELDEWTTMSIEDRLQRDPDIKRIKEQIAPYIAGSQDRFFGAVIVLIYKGEVIFESIKALKANIPAGYQLIADKMGFLTIAGCALIMLDGQHRLLALEMVIKPNHDNRVDGVCREEVPNDDICVIFIHHESNEKTRRIFNKVNRYAKSTSRSDNIITSEDDGNAIIARNLLNEGAPLGWKVKGTKNEKEDIVEWKNNTITARSAKLTTISVVYETVKLILNDKNVSLGETSRPSEEDLEQYYEWVEQFWNIVLEGLQPYQDALHNTSKIPQMRKDDQPYSLLFKSLPQIALFKGLIAATRNDRLSLREAVKRANTIDWSMSSKNWTNVLVTPSGTMARAQQAHNLGGKLIAYLIGADKMTEQEIAQIQREYSSAYGVNINDPNIKLMPLPKPVVEPVSEAVKASV
ncbi:MAG: DNA sulfur modification protein DndB [Nostoc sp. DedQUE04]|uniref:DNA sulfur modification protein DndB n=1 Tax=Nostoc sp. DedQUE04 TaxID=3075390 RepID=UPI002AD36386|nr:DNA sulfur modification protein DndB [Nostoc sp. DedQUE04]MDZ8136814.1 DNA sulfur modification protein DndB [Nostoc sp. DedQUE04]